MTTIRLPDGVHLIVSTVLADILDAAGIAPGPDVVGRVRSLIGERDEALAAHIYSANENMRIQPRVTEICEVLDKAGIVGDTTADRVRELVRRLEDAVAIGKDHAAKVREVCMDGKRIQADRDKIAAERADFERRLDAVTLDRDSLVKTLETVRGERNTHSLTAQQCHKALTEARVRDGALPDRVATLIGERNDHRAKVKALIAERADLARRLEQAEGACDNFRAYLDDANKALATIGAHVIPTGLGDVGDRLEAVVIRVVEALHRLQRERDEAITALRPKPTGPVVEWRGDVLYVNDSNAGHIYRRRDGMCDVHVGRVSALCLFGPTARKLAELLANHDPGGRWTVAGHTVPVDVVRAVCGSVAVGWEAA